LGKVKKIPLGG